MTPQHHAAESVIYLFYKDLNSRFIGCNDAFLNASGFKKKADIIGKTDYDMPWQDTASLYRDGDQAVLDGVILYNMNEPQKQNDGEKKIILTSKIPLINLKGQMIGIAGSYRTIQSKSCIQKAIINDISISSRQLECLILLAKGCIAKRIAMTIGISEKTVQTHIEILKLKLGCHSKQELIDIAWQSEFVKEKIIHTNI